jgi:predicted secreted hydrolase
MLLWIIACTVDSHDSSPTPDYCDEQPSGKVNLPADDAPHSSPIEWWYWVGHLADASGNHYGFHEVFFLFDLAGPARLTGFTVTDPQTQQFPFTIEYDAEGQTMPEGGYTFSHAGQTATGGDGTDVLHGETGDYGADLVLQSRKPAVLQHGDGYTEYSFGGDTYYYSRTRMDVRGSLRTPSGETDVTGTAWFDHQWGNLLAATVRGWDWVSMQLDDGRDVMIFFMHGDDGPELVGASISGANCAVTEVPAEQVSMEALSTWTSPHTGCTWPSGWTLQVGDEQFTLAPVMQDQELYNPSNTYWEGEVAISGDARGMGFVELTGYCPGNGM